MRNRIITQSLIGLLIAISMVSILLQMVYLKKLRALSNDQFISLAHRALDEVSHEVEREEVRRYLRSGLSQTQIDRLSRGESAGQADSLEAKVYTSYLSDGSEMWNNYEDSHLGTCPSWARARNDYSLRDAAITNRMQEIFFKTYFYHRTLLDELVLHTILHQDNAQLFKMIDTDLLERCTHEQFAKVGITEPFEISLYNSAGRRIFSSNPSIKGEALHLLSVDHVIFAHNKSKSEKQPYIRITFFKQNHYSGLSSFSIPSFITLIVIIFLSFSAILILIRQQRLLKERKDLVSNLTHELKTPVSSIRLACEMFTDPHVEQSIERRTRITQMMLKEVDRLTLLVDQMMQSAILDTKNIAFHPSHFDAHQEILDLVSAYKMKITQEKGRLHTLFEASEHQLYCDKISFQNIVSNLIDNSIKYRRPEVPPEITLSTHNDEGYIIISVEDNGIGISKQDSQRVFEQFFRVHTGDRHDVKGFGLGLNYVQKVVQAMGGRVQLKSKLGVGTRFDVYLPVDKEEAAPNSSNIV